MLFLPETALPLASDSFLYTVIKCQTTWFPLHADRAAYAV